MSNSYSHLTSKCFICIPFNRLQKNLQTVISNRIQPEIGLDEEILYQTRPEEFKKVARALKEAGLSCTLHAPFTDLSPGATDQYIRTVSRDKLNMAFQLLPIFKPEAIVCHLNYEENKHSYKKDEWLNNSLETWRFLLAKAEHCQVPLMLENTYEHGPTMHERVLANLASDYARFCLDVGHILAFAGNSWQDWLPPLSPWLGQLHLHDNHGDHDSHLAIGDGRFDFKNFFAYLKKKDLAPLITLEPHDEKNLWKCLENLDRLGFLATT